MSHAHPHPHAHDDHKQSDALAVFETKGQFKPWRFDLHALQPNDVEIRITHCGMCHSDLHTVDGDWGDQPWPVVPGHEIIGIVTAVGPAVKDIKVGMRVGVGPQALSCGTCRQCKQGQESFCDNGMIGTYTAKLPDGYVTKGGYALYNRTDAHFVFPIPESLDSAETAPILCAGITVFAPLKNYGVKQGSRVAVIGIGGLGHMALQFARAMGAEVTAISSSANKEAEAKGFGAHHFINSADKSQVAAAKKSFDLVLNTTSGKVDFAEFLPLVAHRGTWVQLGAGADITVPTFPLLFGGVSIAGSLIGPPAYFHEMLALCAQHKIKAAIERIPWDQVEAGRAKVKQNTVRYRMVLEMPKA